MSSAIVEEFNGWLADLVAGEGSDLHGKTILLYRPRAEGDERPRIHLPA